jgi:cytochrome c oxidase assembly protein subunit 15
MFIPSILLESSQWHLSSFINYDANSFMPSFIQFFHRNTAYVLTALIFWFIFKHHKHSDRSVLTALYLMGGMNAVQVLLGIITIINCKGTIPVDLGVYHQAGAVLLLSTILWAKFKLR